MQMIWTWTLWGLDWSDASYYGWRHALHIGPLHLLVGKVVP
jgi:hypothetical protein